MGHFGDGRLKNTAEFSDGEYNSLALKQVGSKLHPADRRISMCNWHECLSCSEVYFLSEKKNKLIYLSQKSADWRKHQKLQNFLDMGQAKQGETLANKIIHLIKYILIIKMMLSHYYCSSSFRSHQNLTTYFHKKT